MKVLNRIDSRSGRVTLYPCFVVVCIVKWEFGGGP
jgi:hypothetical protein